MCRVEWGRAMVEAQRLSDPARLRGRDQIDGEYAQPLDVEALAEQVIRNQEAEAPEPQPA